MAEQQAVNLKVAGSSPASEAKLVQPGWFNTLRDSFNNPLLFVTDILKVEPEPWQREALKTIGQSDRLSIRSGHGVGKTAFESWLVLWFMSTRRRCKIPVVSNSHDQLRDTIWPEIAQWHRRLPEALRTRFEVQKERIINAADPDSAFAVPRTASKDNPEALQGFHAEHLLFLIDEASGIPEKVFEVGMGALSTEGAKAVMAGNPTRTSGFFYDTHHSLRHKWSTMHVSCLDVPRAQGHISDVEAKYGKGSNAWRVRVLGEFPTMDDETVIPLDYVTSAIGRHVSELPYYPVWGVDVARFGSDRTAIAKRQSNRLLEPVKFWSMADLMTTAGRLQREFEDTHEDKRPQEILIDSVGMGAGVVDRCRELRLPVRGVNVAEAASLNERYMRLRDELWFRGREWFADRACTIPQDDALIGELTGPLYSFTSTGKIVVESKQDMKKRGVKSPDLADAFLLTFAGGLRRKVDRHRSLRKFKRSAWAA